MGLGCMITAIGLGAVGIVMLIKWIVTGNPWLDGGDSTDDAAEQFALFDILTSDDEEDE